MWGGLVELVVGRPTVTQTVVRWICQVSEGFNRTPLRRLKMRHDAQGVQLLGESTLGVRALFCRFVNSVDHFTDLSIDMLYSRNVIYVAFNSCAL